jgi:hypothetical protein
VEIDPLEDQGVERRIILEGILRKSFGRAWSGLVWLRIGARGALL